MRLLIISSEFPPYSGGIGTHAHQIGLLLQQMGWKIAAVTPQDYAAKEDIDYFNAQQPFPIRGMRPVPGAPLEAIYRWSIASAWVKKWKPNLLFATGQRAVWLTAVLAPRHRLPWVAIGHGTEFGSTVPLERNLTRWAFQKANAVICVSEFTRNYMITSRILPRLDKVIPNGADSSRFTVLESEEVRAFREKLGFNSSKLILTVGNVSERKGQDVVIRSLPRILEKEHHTHYLIVGKPSKKTEFMKIANELGVANHVHFVGRVDPDELVRYFNSCDVFVMTSRHTADGDFEGYGIAVLEAALCGKPAVVSGNCGLQEAVTEGKTGLIVPENDPTGTADAILSLLTQNDRRYQMGKEARKLVLEGRTWSHRAFEYDSFLRSLVKATR
jgi:phosphatidyl-myo-inositol dimannoside synthase